MNFKKYVVSYYRNNEEKEEEFFENLFEALNYYDELKKNMADSETIELEKMIDYSGILYDFELIERYTKEKCGIEKSLDYSIELLEKEIKKYNNYRDLFIKQQLVDEVRHCEKRLETFYFTRAMLLNIKRAKED